MPVYEVQHDTWCHLFKKENRYLKTMYIWSNPMKWTHFGVLSATVGVTLLHNFSKIFRADGLYSAIWYIDIMQQFCI